MSFGEPVPDATGELRLQLMQAQDQREAFRALGHRDVLAVIREALATDLSKTCDKLRAEITRMEGENHRLRMEVERLTNCYGGANMEAEEHCRRAMELRKAGDAMQDAVETYFELLPMLVNEVRAKAMLKGRKAIKEWNAAKEGKPS